MTKPSKPPVGDNLIQARQLAQGPDAVIASFISPGKATFKSQAVHLENLTAVHMSHKKISSSSYDSSEQANFHNHIRAQTAQHS